MNLKYFTRHHLKYTFCLDKAIIVFKSNFFLFKNFAFMPIQQEQKKKNYLTFIFQIYKFHE